MTMAVVNRGSGSNTTSSATYSFSPASNFTATTLAVLCIAQDNSVLGGLNPFSSVTDSLGNTWVSRVSVTQSPGGANSGVSINIVTCDQSIAPLTTATTITVNWSANTQYKAYVLRQITGTAGFIPIYEGNNSATGNGTTPSVSYVVKNTGDVVVGMVGIEGNPTVTADTDTTNGSWSAQTTVNGGAGSGIRVAVQNKVTTATGLQTYNPTLSAALDYAAAVAAITEKPLFGYDPFGQNGVYGI